MDELTKREHDYRDAINSGLATILVLVLAFALAKLSATYKLGTSTRAWDDRFEEWDTILERHPAREPNPAALELESFEVE